MHGEENVFCPFKTQRRQQKNAEKLFSVQICNGAEFLIVPKELFRISYDSLVAPYDFLNPIPFDAQAARRVSEDFLPESLSNGVEWKFDKKTFEFLSNGCRFEILTGKLYDDDKPDRKIDIQVDTVPSASAFDNINVFYLCRKCGKVYWDGAHMKRYVKKVGLVFNKNE